MDNPVDNIVDLGLVNFVAHPENKNYVVFRFVDVERADSFENMLKEANIEFEKGEEDKRGKTYVLFGLRNRDFKKVEQINFKVEAMHKKPFIPVAGIRWFVIAIATLIMTLTLIGYCKAQKKLAESKVYTKQSMVELPATDLKSNSLNLRKF